MELQRAGIELIEITDKVFNLIEENAQSIDCEKLRKFAQDLFLLNKRRNEIIREINK